VLLLGKTMSFSQPITEAGLVAFLSKGQIQFPPLRTVKVQTEYRFAPNAVLDALLTLGWRGRTYRFAVEVRRLWTPKAVAEAMEMVQRYARASKLYPLILVPYLSEEQLLGLEAQEVSGIDLCGNGIVIVPEKLLVFRSGAPNRYRWEGTIKNVYRRSSSLVSRIFLLLPEFNSVKQALEEIRKRGGAVTLSTVSKVCKSLEEDLVIERGRGEAPVLRRLRLLQPDKLLDLLADNYTPPEVSCTFRGKTRLSQEELRKRLAEWGREGDRRIALTGASSVESYAVMAREPVVSFYCSDLDSAVRSLGENIRETDRFANVALLETRDDIAYFDRRPGLVASSIQTYLELAAGDKRDRETADQVRRVILESLARARQKG
jgi:hypothetical protein